MSDLVGNVDRKDRRNGEVDMAQEQVQKQGGGDGDDGADGAAAAGQERREKLGEDVDAILDEIDDVLEENAEDFVRAYVQKGGE
ncbi:Prokaryotic ubiquitin-like protein Pup [Actinosynnema sp. ALI-1.44]|nr:ubiquitin-like protein Pup [Saccharothrix mutabilis subsp. capreolus]